MAQNIDTSLRYFLANACLDRLKLLRNNSGILFVTTQQEVAEARLAAIKVLEEDSIEDRNVALLRNEQTWLNLFEY